MSGDGGVRIFETAISAGELALADDSAPVVILGDAALQSFDPEMLERLTARKTAAIAAVSQTPGTSALAAALHCDWLAWQEDATIELHLSDPGALSGLVWRLSSSAVRLVLSGEARLTARRAEQLGLIDALVPSGEDSVKWAVRWLGTRSLTAFQSGARLIRLASEQAERAEFARLFAAGTPQEGLAAFLEKRKPIWTKEER